MCARDARRSPAVLVGRVLPQIAGSLVERVANLGQLQTRGEDHDAQQAPWVSAQKTNQRLTKQETQKDLADAEENDARAAASSESVLRSQATCAVAEGHAAEP